MNAQEGRGLAFALSAWSASTRETPVASRTLRWWFVFCTPGSECSIGDGSHSLSLPVVAGRAGDAVSSQIIALT